MHLDLLPLLSAPLPVQMHLFRCEHSLRTLMTLPGVILTLVGSGYFPSTFDHLALVGSSPLAQESSLIPPYPLHESEPDTLDYPLI